MPYSKNPEAYPPAIKSLLQTLATSEERIQETLPPMPRKKAIRMRAQFYALRKLVAERFLEEGNSTAAERHYATSISLENLPGDMASLTISNQHGDWDDNFLAGVAAITEKYAGTSGTAKTGVIPPASSLSILSKEQMEELAQTATKAQEESLSEQQNIHKHLSRYSPGAENKYFITEEEPSEEDRLAWEEHQRSIESDELESKHSRNATPEERKAAKEKK